MELDNFTFKVLYIEQNKSVEHIHNTFTILCEKSKTVYFTSSVMENIVEPSARSRLPVKLICCIAFGSASSYCCSLKSSATIL